jgi:FMN phosphatase YigB (HAD superfamily)
MAMLPPQALLLDFGGVIAESADDTVDPGLPARVHRIIRQALSLEQVVADIDAGWAAREEWRRDAANPELTAVQIWGTLVARDWPVPARAAVVEHAAELTYATAVRRWDVVEGMPEVLDFTLGRGLPVAIVSNTCCGQAYRDFLERSGLSAAFAFQVYSDEIGVFKPHPEMILSAARELYIPPSQCWFVGDSIARDVECGRRAGVGATILRPSSMWPTDKEKDSDKPEPDAVIADGHELLKLLKRSLDSAA